MTSQTQFKQQCPSCEAMVPIKDSSLVGKKVDCPKCKYRFVVEEPGGGDGTDADADAAEETQTKIKSKPDAGKPKADGDRKGKGDLDGKAKKKKKAEKKGAPVMLLVGGGLGLLAVVGLLVVGAILYFTSGSETPKTPSSPGPQANSVGGSRPNTPPGGGGPMGGIGGPMGGIGGPMGGIGGPGGNTERPASERAGDAATNLLPNETQAVYSVNVTKFRDSTLGGAAFRSTSGFRPEMFRDGLGLPLEQMSRYVRGESMKNNWVFNIIQMIPTFAVKADVMKAKLGSQKGPKSPISGHEYYMVAAANDTLDSLSAIDFFSILNPNGSPSRSVPKTPLAWHLYDDQTVILAEVAQMEQFLKGGRKPDRKTQVEDTRPAGPMGPMRPGSGPMGGPAAVGAGFSPMGAGSGPMGGPSAVGAGSGPMGGPSAVGAGFSPMGGPGGPVMPGAGNTGGGGALFTDRAAYLTINPGLKRMLDKMEESRQPVIFSCAAMDLESASSKIVDNIRATTTLGALIPLPTIVSAGMSLQTLSETHLTALAAIELRREDDARTLNETIQRDVLAKAAAMLSKWMGTDIDTGAGGSSGGGGFGPMAGAGGFGPVAGGGGLAPPMVGGGGGTGIGGISPPPPMGGGFGPPMGGGGLPTKGGGGGLAPPMGTGGFGPPMGGFGPMGGLGPMGGGFNPGSGRSGSNRPGSSLQTWHLGSMLFVSFDAEIIPETDRKIREAIEAQVIRLKGMTDVAASSHPRWHELAGTAIQLKGQNRILTGTHPIAEDASGKSFMSRGPNQRVSWMVDLLPMLGKPEVYNEIDTKLPWRSEKNLRAAATWIPQFINPQYPRESWQARLPSLPGNDLGVTHYTALSGIGLDAAEWDENDPAARKKLGLFGYNRPTNFNDIPDGASNTIYLITTPPNVSRPWIAGGGATVQGVPEKNSIAPFVANHGQKRGAYVAMADGSVRFLSADTPDAVFKALVTKAGGDDVGDLETVAPKVVGGSASKPATKAEETPATKKPDPPK
jgi:hypothetical protein